MDKKTQNEIDNEAKEIKKTRKEADKKIKKLTGLDDDEDNDDLENEKEIDEMLKEAESELKYEEEMKKLSPEDAAEKKLVDELDKIPNKKQKKEKKENKEKKKKKAKKEEEDDSESDEEEEYRKWKEQRKLEKLKKQKEKEKKKAKKNNDDDDDEDNNDDDEYQPKKESKKKKNKKPKKEESDEDDNDEFPFPKDDDNKKEKKMKKDDSEEENDDKNNLNDEGNEPQGPAISKRIYDKIKKEDLKMVLLLMKKSNGIYQEGKALCSQGRYMETINCYKKANVAFNSVNKLIQTKGDAYPKEFKMIMASKINEKIKLVRQSASECMAIFRGKATGMAVDNPEKAKEMLTKKNTMGNNANNYNYNFDTLNKMNNNNNANNNNLNNNNINSNRNYNNNNYNNINNNDPNKQKSLHDKEEDAMDEKIESEIMSKNPGVKFSDIIGMNDMKQTLYEIIVVPQIRPDLFTGIRKPQRGILLFGPPGTGKTMIAKAIASECGSTFFNISASSLTSKWVGESEKTVKSLFKIAYKKVPSIIFIDEIDSILSKRSESENEATKRLKTEFLIQFDGLGSNTNARLLVIAATNRPMDLDEALLRRLPKRVYCGPLDEEGRFEFIKKVINRVECNLSDDDIREIAKRTNDYSNSDLMELCREAAYQPVRELTNEEILKLKKFRPLVKQDLINAVQKIRGTLSKKVKDELQKWNEQFGGV